MEDGFDCLVPMCANRELRGFDLDRGSGTSNTRSGVVRKEKDGRERKRPGEKVCEVREE